MKARLVDERPDFYVLHDGQAAFRVPKQGLSEAMHARIRGMGGDGYAGGGRVKPKWEIGNAADKARRKQAEHEEEAGPSVAPAAAPAPQAEPGLWQRAQAAVAEAARRMLPSDSSGPSNAPRSRYPIPTSLEDDELRSFPNQQALDFARQRQAANPNQPWETGLTLEQLNAVMNPSSAPGGHLVTTVGPGTDRKDGALPRQRMADGGQVVHAWNGAEMPWQDDPRAAFPFAAPAAPPQVGQATPIWPVVTTGHTLGGAGGGVGADSPGAGGAGGQPQPYMVDRGGGASEGGPSANQLPPGDTMRPIQHTPRVPTGPQPLPPGVRPAGSTPSTEQPPQAAAPSPAVAPSRSIPGYGLGTMKQATGAALEGGELRANAEAQAARDTAEAIGAAQAQLKANELSQKRMAEESRVQAGELMARRRALSEELNRIDGTIDPGRFWASKTTDQKVVGIIGLVLGALGTSKDGVNRAAVMLGQAVDRDIEAQKAEFQQRMLKGRAKLDAADSAYAQHRQLFGDDMAAMAATKATILENLSMRLQQIQATTSDPLAQARLKELEGQLLGQKAKFEQDAGRATEDALHHRAVEAAARGAGGIGAAEAKDLRTAESNAQDSLDLIRTIRNSLDKTQSAVPGVTALKQNFGEEAPTIETAVTSLTLKLKDMAKLGQISASDSALLDKLIGDPQAIVGKGSSEKAKQDRLKALEAIVLNSIANQRKATMGVPAQ